MGGIPPEQLKKVREIRTALFTSTLEIQQKDTKQMLYEEIRKSDKHDLD
tara:strand:- start:671 stop:817 length:147 start_codon:yes stop_codon:yes gene_type:complete